MKKRYFLVLFLLFGVFFLRGGQFVQAAEKETVMTIHLKDEYKTTSVDVYATHTAEHDYDFQLAEEDFYLLKKNQVDKVQVQISVENTSIILPESLSYERTLVVDGTASFGETISFSYRENGEIRQARLYYYIFPFEFNVSLDSIVLSAASKGFHPSNGNYLPIRAMMSIQRNYYEQGRISLRLRVKNKAGKYVFQKTFTAESSDTCFSFYYKWNGKASKNNTAKVKAGSYVKSGTYQIELYLTVQDRGYVKSAVKTKSIVISKKAPAGKKGVSAAKKVPVFTGQANIDYMAEMMIKSAGVKSGMSEDQKVKKIYHYMTKYFKHRHDIYSGKYKVYYNLNQLQAKIRSYRRQTEKKVRQGKLIFDYERGYDTEYCMQIRSGVCSDHAMIFAILCKHVGVDAGVCSGYYKNRNGSLAGHSWNYAVVNGNTYYYDVDVEIQNYKKGQGDYYWYKKTKSQAKKNHVFQ